MTYGFLGLGIMGTAMATNLVRAGFDVVVWNRTETSCSPLCELGARSAATPAEAVAQADITFVMLSDDAALRELWYAEGGVLAGVSAGHGVVNMSTIGDDTSAELSAAIAQRGGRYLEAPVTGTKKPAEDGLLVILGAGDRHLYDAALPAFEVMSKRSVYLGEVGMGARMKLVINMIMGNVMLALAEGVALAERSDLDPALLLDLVAEGAVANPMFGIKGPMLIDHRYPPSFPLKHMKKDLKLALQLAEKQGQVLPQTAEANETFKRAELAGRGDEDFSAVFEALQ